MPLRFFAMKSFRILVCLLFFAGCASAPPVIESPRPEPTAAPFEAKSQQPEAPAVAGCRVFTSVEEPLEFDQCVESVTSDGTLVLKPAILKAVKPHLSRASRLKHLWLMLTKEKSSNPVFRGPVVAYMGQGPSGVSIARQVAYFDNGPDFFSEGLARSISKNGKVGFINDRLVTVIREEFDFATPFKNGKSAACTGCVSESVGEHSVVKDGQWRLIDKRGKLLKGPALTQAEAYDALGSMDESKPASR